MEAVTQEQMWDEEAAKLDAGDPPAESLAAAPDTPPLIEEPQPAPEDPFAGVPDIVKARLAELDELRNGQAQLLHHVKTAEGRVAAMQRDLQQAKAAQQTVAPQEAPSQGQMVAAATNPQEWEQLKQDFPEWATAIDKRLASEISRIPAQKNLVQPEHVIDYVQRQMLEFETKSNRRIEEARIEGKYDNWRDVVNTSDFANWFAVQNPETRTLADSNSARDAIRMLDLFHDSKKRSAVDIKQERGARLAAAATTRPGQTPPPQTLDDMSPAELWNYEAAKREKTRATRGF